MRPSNANLNCFEIGRPLVPASILFVVGLFRIAIVEFGFASSVGFALGPAAVVKIVTFAAS